MNNSNFRPDVCRRVLLQQGLRYIILIIFAALYSSPCAAQHESMNRNPGIVQMVIDAKAYPCFDAYEGRPRQTEYVIDSESDYRRYKESFQKHCDFSDIDFDKHTLLGMYGGGNNYCSVEYFRHVEDDQANARYIFTLTVLQKGFCKRAVRWHWHWVLVPRIPESYEVEFKVDRIREKSKTSEKEKPVSPSSIDRSYPCRSITGTTFTPGQSGVYGKTVSGPTRPVNSEDDTTEAYMPFRASGVVKRVSDNKEAGRFTSDVNGEFRVSLSPGKYVIESLPINNKPWPRPDSPCVVVIKENYSVEIRIQYDTGIR